MDNEGDKNGQRKCQKWTPKVPKMDSNNKDNNNKEGNNKESVYISSSQESIPYVLGPDDIEILPPAKEEEETTQAQSPFNPHAEGARQKLERYHKEKRMRCPFDEFWRLNENKNWMVNGTRVKDPVALLAGFENRYVREHPFEEILVENGIVTPEDAKGIDKKKMLMFQAVMSSKLY